MANTPERSFLSTRSAKSIESAVLKRVATRLTEDLAVGEAIAPSGSAFEIVNCQGASRLRVVFKTTGAGTPRLRLIPVLADGATAAATSIQTSTPGVATEGVASFDLYGETLMKIEVAETGGGSAIGIGYVDVFML